MLIETGNYTEVSNQLNEFESEIINLPEEIQDDMYDYVDYLKIVKDYRESDYDESIISNNISFLENLAEIDNAHGNIGAQILLENYCGTYDYPEKILYIEPSYEDKSLFMSGKKAGVETNFVEKIEIYPNPANDQLIVDYKIEDEWNNKFIEIYDMQGKLIRSIQVEKAQDKLKIDVSGLPTGEYLISFNFGETNKYTKKININH